MAVRLKTVLSTVGVVVGSVLIALGAVTFFLPLPVGAVLLAAGAALLVASSPRVVRWLRRRRARHPAIDRELKKSTDKLPEPAGSLVRRTEPRAPDDD